MNNNSQLIIILYWIQLGKSELGTGNWELDLNFSTGPFREI